MGFAVSKIVFIPPKPSNYDILSFPHNLIFIPTNPKYPIPDSSSQAIPALFIHSESAHNLIIYCHGNACDLGTIYPEACILSQSLRSHVICMEYPGYGLFTGSPSETAAFNSLKTVVSYVREKMGYPAARILLYGRSLGTAVVTRIASEMCAANTPPAGLILQSPFKSIKCMAEKLIKTSFFISNIFDTKEAIKQVTCPLLLIHGMVDDLIPYTHSEELADLAKTTRKRVHLCPDADHNEFHYNADVIIPFANFMYTYCSRSSIIIPSAQNMMTTQQMRNNPLLSQYADPSYIDLPEELFNAPRDARLPQVGYRSCGLSPALSVPIRCAQPDAYSTYHEDADELAQVISNNATSSPTTNLQILATRIVNPQERQTLRKAQSAEAAALYIQQSSSPH